MEIAVPWKDLVKVIEPYYPSGEGRGRRPIGIERMLQIHFLQIWFNLSDPAVEEAIYDIKAMCDFVKIDLGRSQHRMRRQCASFVICSRSTN